MIATMPATGAVFEQSQNAIFTLLQPPVLRAGLRPQNAAPTTHDIPPVALTTIETVDDAAFDAYNQRVGAVFGKLQRTEDTTERPAAYLQGSSANQHGRPPALSTIPAVYFDEDFHLQNPRTFDVVSEQSYIAGTARSAMTGAGPRAGTRTAPTTTALKSLATNAILQEKLSWYLDTVEVYLVDAIAQSAAAFFSALVSLRHLSADVNDSLQKIKLLRESVAVLETDTVAAYLDLVRRRRMLCNLRVMSDAVRQLQRIVDGVGHIEALVEQGHVEAALDAIDATERLIGGGGDEGSDALDAVPRRDLSGIDALQGPLRDLSVLRSRIGKAFEKRAVETLVGDLRQHVQSVSTDSVLVRWGAAWQRERAKGRQSQALADAPASTHMTNELREALSPAIRGLYRSKALASAIRSYREQVLREIRDVLRRPLPRSADDADSAAPTSTAGTARSRTNEEKSTMLARSIRALDAVEAERLLASIFIGVTETLRRLQTQAGILLDVAYTMQEAQEAADAGEANDVRSERQQEMHMALNLPGLLGDAVDASHESISKILRVRSEQSTRLPLDDFLRYVALTRLFGDACEAVAGRAGASSLQASLDSHIHDFVAAHHDREIQALTQAMDADRWQVQDGTAKDRAMLQQILASSASDPAPWAVPPVQNGTPDGSTVGDTDAAGDAGDAAARGPMVVGNDTFFVPRSALVCLAGVSRYLRLLCNLSSTRTPDVSLSLAAYLRMFDARGRQLVLGAGALRTVGLRNIKTSHLALVSRAMAFVAALLPYLRACVRRHRPIPAPTDGGSAGEFDKVQRAFEEHQDAIRQKLADIMASRALVLPTNARQTDWDAEASSTQDVRAYMADLVRDMNKLYTVLDKYWPAREVELVMVPVVAGYKEQLSEAFQAADPKTDAGKASMSRDVAYLIAQLGTIQGFADLGASLTTIIESKNL
ncbi:vacuolar protein sorting-associated protein [Sporothrix brasiliensis 5110]|uniref:Vacuolar protein sorting-associated protein n=1 Tax=Sporothrix brasiliensis 5110 TaxID=1398154 RepID=A0A0C2F9J1_9PEZI|nr:vacuolar protein sorting-associated protein [Sporothrix brasiliensis 5110]KIH87743.1 vacuolar protein sorting-associated protein [Sporothrix brasiliensis 5110]